MVTDGRVKVTPEVLDRMTYLRKSGLSYRKVGEIIGIESHCVARHLNPVRIEHLKIKRLERRKDKVRTSLNGGRSKLHKVDGRRPKPVTDECEICSKVKRLNWHHWDDLDLSKGAWVCTGCHTFVERIDREEEVHHVEKYLRIKAVCSNSEAMWRRSRES